jgi:hypothetical protein
MKMTPEDFYLGFLVENYEDWQQDRYSIRRAFNAAVSALHLADTYCLYHQRHSPTFLKKYGRRKGLERFQKALFRREPHFKTIRDMATAYKHLYPGATCDVSSGGSIDAIRYPGGEIVHDVPDEPQGHWEVLIRRRNAMAVKFSVAMDAVIAMWDSIILKSDVAVEL